MFQVFIDDFSKTVETTAEAVELAYNFDGYVRLLNPLKKGLTEAEHDIHSRIAAMDENDSWPGAKYETDIVPREWRLARQPSGWYRYQKARIDQVRV